MGGGRVPASLAPRCCILHPLAPVCPAVGGNVTVGGSTPGQQRSLTVGGSIDVQGSAAVSEALGECVGSCLLLLLQGKVKMAVGAVGAFKAPGALVPSCSVCGPSPRLARSRPYAKHHRLCHL